MSARDELAGWVRYGIAECDGDLDDLDEKVEAQLDAYRAEVLREAWDAVWGKRLHDNTGAAGDIAYMMGIEDAADAVAKLRGKS